MPDEWMGIIAEEETAEDAAERRDPKRLATGPGDDTKVLPTGGMKVVISCLSDSGFWRKS